MTVKSTLLSLFSSTGEVLSSLIFGSNFISRKMTATSGKIDNVVEIFLKLESNDQAVVNEIQQFVGEQYQDGEPRAFGVFELIQLVYFFDI